MGHVQGWGWVLGWGWPYGGGMALWGDGSWQHSTVLWVSCLQDALQRFTGKP